MTDCKLPYDYLQAIELECGGMGTCDTSVPTTFLNAQYDFSCVCDYGYVGRSDWVDTTGLDCQVNYVIIRVLWSFNLLVLWLALVKMLSAAGVVRAKFHDISKQKRAIGKPYGIRDNKGFFTTCVLLGVWAPSHIVLGVMKLYDPSLRVAIDILPTVFWYLSRTGFYVAVQIFQPSLLQNLLRGNKETDGLVQRNFIFTWMCTIGMVCIPLACIPVIMTGGRNLAISTTCVAVFFSGQALILLSYFYQAVYTKRRIGAILQASYDLNQDSKTLDIKTDLESIQKEVIRQASVQGILYAAFAVIPFMWNKHDYILPISHITIPIIALKTVLAVSGVNHHDTSHKETRGSLPENTKATSGHRSSQPMVSQPHRSSQPEGNAVIAVQDDSGTVAVDKGGMHGAEVSPVVN